MVANFAGTLLAIVSFLLTFDAGGSLILNTTSPAPLVLGTQIVTCEFEVVIEEFIRGKLYLEIYYNNVYMIPQYMLILNWSTPLLSTSGPEVWRRGNRWDSAQKIDTKEKKQYSIMLRNVTTYDARIYEVHAHQPYSTQSSVKEVEIVIQGIPIENRLVVRQNH